MFCIRVTHFRPIASQLSTKRFNEYTYIAVSIHYVDYAAQHYDEIQYIPRITEVVLLNNS